MGVVIARWGLVGFMVISALVLGSQAKAEEWKMEQGGIEPGKVMLGMRAGFAPVTQTVSAGTSTDVGSLVNFQAMYSLNKWFLVGMMLEWERHSMNTAGSGLDLGHQDTVSVLPTVESPSSQIRPGHSIREYEFWRERQQLWGKQSDQRQYHFTQQQFRLATRLGRRLHAHQTVRAEHGDGLQTERRTCHSEWGPR